MKNRAIVELKTPLQHCLGKEQVAEVQKVVTPTFLVQVKPKMIDKELEISKTTGSDPSLRRVMSEHELYEILS